METGEFLLTDNKDTAKFLLERGAGFLIYKNGLWCFYNGPAVKQLDIENKTYYFVDEYPF